MPLILASASSIRHSMLEQAGVRFAVSPAAINEDEEKLRHDDPAALAEALAVRKAEQVSARHGDSWVIGSDSVASVGGERFDKPADRNEAAQHLRAFSGKVLRLSSAVALARGGTAQWRCSDHADLTVRRLSERFIADYLDAEWPAIGHCAGAFRLEGMGVQLFESIDGDYFTILGMPLLPLLGALRDRGEIPGMITIALTGSIGMGKSTVAAMFAKAGIPVFDADAVVRVLQGPGGALVERIEQRFPGCTIEGAVDRERLAAMVLADPAELAALEEIVHPAVHHERTRFILGNGDAPALLFDIPLLFETGGEGAFDKVVVVSAPAEVQRRRVLERPGMTPGKFEAILARQVPDAVKRARADFVIDTGGELSTTQLQVDRIIACLGLGHDS